MPPPEIKGLTAMGSLPILRDANGAVIGQSLAILYFIEDTIGPCISPRMPVMLAQECCRHLHALRIHQSLEAILPAKSQAWLEPGYMSRVTALGIAHDAGCTIILATVGPPNMKLFTPSRTISSRASGVAVA
jgi:hypothetical protein